MKAHSLVLKKIINNISSKAARYQSLFLKYPIVELLHHKLHSPNFAREKKLDQKSFRTVHPDLSPNILDTVHDFLLVPYQGDA